MDYKLELVLIPVSDVDRAKKFYVEQAGFDLLVDTPTGLMLEVQGPKREFLMPFRKEFVVELDRAGRKLLVQLPEGLTDL